MWSAIADLLARVILGLLRLNIEQREKHTSVSVDTATDEDKKEAKRFGSIETGCFAFFLLLTCIASGCAKPREYVLSKEKVYLIARPVVVSVVVNDKELGPVVVDWEFQPGDKIKRE